MHIMYFEEAVLPLTWQSLSLCGFVHYMHDIDVSNMHNVWTHKTGNKKFAKRSQLHSAEKWTASNKR